jgi:DNA-binding NarL/FixJ family response regulator
MSCQLITAALHQSPFQTRVIGYATDAVGICEGLDRNETDVALIGAHLREGSLAGFNAVRQIRGFHSKLNVVMILDSMEPAVVVEAFRAGASGVFSRDESFELLCKCIHAVYQGQVWASSRELHFVIDALRSTQPAPTQAICPKGQRLLTDREEGVVRLVAEGLTNRDISQHLNLSEHTVRNYHDW